MLISGGLLGLFFSSQTRPRAPPEKAQFHVPWVLLSSALIAGGLLVLFEGVRAAFQPYRGDVDGPFQFNHWLYYGRGFAIFFASVTTTRAIFYAIDVARAAAGTRPTPPAAAP
jgi:hypothetical protein